MNQREILERLWDLGHFHNPAHPSGMVSKAGASVLKLTDKPARIAIQSYQEFMAPDFDRLAMKHHSRRGVTDGDAGPATFDLLVEPRCGFPDYLPPDSALAQKEQVNWPDSCRRELVFGRDFSSLPGLDSAGTDKIWWAAANNWTHALADLEMIANEGKTQRGVARIYARLERMTGSTLAWSYLATNRCSDWLQQAYNSGVNWQQLAFAAAVATHEVGHAIGLPHNRDSNALMYPSIHSRSIGRRGYPNSTDLAQAKGLGYQLSGLPQISEDKLYRPRGEDPDPPTDPDEPDDPKKAKYFFQGSELYADGKPTGHHFQITHKVSL